MVIYILFGLSSIFTNVKHVIWLFMWFTFVYSEYKM